MSRGKFEYLDYDYKWDIAIEATQKAITENPDNYGQETIEELKKGLECMLRAIEYLRCIDSLLSWSYGEKCFHEDITIIERQ